MSSCAVLVVDEEVAMRTVPLDVRVIATTNRPRRAGIAAGVFLRDLERELLERALEATGGNRTRAAELMGVSLRTVRNKIVRA